MFGVVERMLDRVRAEQNSESSDFVERLNKPLTRADIARFVNYSWPIIGATALSLVILAFLYVLTASPSYTATARLLVEPSKQQSNLVFATADASITMDTPQIETQIAVLRSEQITRKALDQLKSAPKGSAKSDAIAERNWFSKLLFGTPEPVSQSDKDADRRAEMKSIQDNLEIKRSGLSFVLDLSYHAGDPQAAAVVVNAIGDAYVQDVLDTRTAAARQGSAWLENRIEYLRRVMNTSAIEVQKFKAKRDYRFAGSNGQAPVATQPVNPLDLEPDELAPRNVPVAPKDEATDQGLTPEQITLDDLESRAQTYRKIYESFLQLYTETVQKQSYPGTNARVISRAEPPKYRSSPQRLLILVAASVFGVFFGVGAALIKAGFDQTVWSPGQIEARFRTRLLGEVGHRSVLASRSDSLWRIVEVQPYAAVTQQLIDTTLALKEAADYENVRVVGIQDATAGANSGIIANNVAYLIARAGQKTLLIDADASRFNAKVQLNLNSSHYLQPVISGAIPVSEAIVPAKSSAHLHYLMADDKSDLIWSDEKVLQLKNIINSVRDQYDMILVRLPLAKPGDRMSSVVDGMVLVSRSRKTKMPQLANIASDIRLVGKPLIGTVISSI